MPSILHCSISLNKRGLSNLVHNSSSAAETLPVIFFHLSRRTVEDVYLLTKAPKEYLRFLFIYFLYLIRMIIPMWALENIDFAMTTAYALAFHVCNFIGALCATLGKFTHFHYHFRQTFIKSKSTTDTCKVELKTHFVGT